MMSADSPSALRRSGRKPQPKKFGYDEVTNFDILNSASKEEVEALQALADDSSGDDFDSDQAAKESDDAEEDVISSADPGSDGTGIATPAEDSDGDASSAGPDIIGTREDGDLPTSPLVKPRSHVYTRRKRPEAGTHIRGITDGQGGSSKVAKGEYLSSLFGTASQDLSRAAKSRDQWSEDIALPRRPNVSGSQGMRHFFSHSPETRQMEAREGWDWYYDHGGRQSLEKTQRSQQLTSEEGMVYIPSASHPQRPVFMGPYGSQSRFDLPALQSLSMHNVWESAPQPNGGQEQDAAAPAAGKRGEGWLLNAGTGVRCLEWAPNHDADSQYLALCTVQPKENRRIGQFKFSPAFTAQSFPSSIQMWSFSTLKGPLCETLLDAYRPPCLRMVICTEWGDPNVLRWCPMPRDARECDEDGSRRRIGLLASVWSDGHVRVLDVLLEQRDDSHDTQYLHFTNAAFTAKPPSTLCTSVAWLSPTEIAVGCANGFLAIWSIYHPPSSSPRPSSPSTCNSPPPLLYYPFHPSYILSLSTAYPLAPHLLASSSVTGNLRLTSLRSPHTDYVLSPRMRHAPSQIHFSEPCHAFLTVDDNDSIKAWPLRRFFSPVNVARIPAAGLCLATGNLHVSVLLGCADGTVCAVNPMRKLLYPKQMSWQLPVLKHEFRGATEEEREKGDEAGKVRITEGFKLKEATMVQGIKGGTGKTVEGVVVATIWEEEGQARAVAWGRSLEVGGWAAMGFGSGLVRVQDLAIRGEMKVRKS